MYEQSPYREQRRKLRARLNDPAYANKIPRIQGRINSLREKEGLEARDWSGWTPKYQTQNTTQYTPATDTTPNPFSQDYWNTLMPQTPMVKAEEPSNLEASPLYQWKLKQGQTALDRQLAARGLFDSSAALTANSEMVQALLADEVERQQKINEWKAQVAAGNADRLTSTNQAGANRLWDILSSQITRGDALSNERFDRQMAILNFLGAQNPMQYVGSSVNESAELQAQMAKYVADYMSQMYPQIWQLVENSVPDFYPTGDTSGATGGSQAYQAGAAG